jgi:hypothetical protein
MTTIKQWISYSGQATDDSSGGIATFSNGDIATAYSVSKSNGASSVIVQRLSKDGAVVWSLDIGADYAPGVGSVLVGSDNKVYVVGGTKKGVSGESGKNDSDIFAAAIGEDGQKIWYKNYGIGIHEIGSQGVLDAEGNIILNGRVSEVNDEYSHIKDVPNFYGAEFTGGWRGFQLKINPTNGSVIKAYTTGSFNSGGELIAVDQSRNTVFVGGYTFGAVNGVGTIGNGDPAGANKYLIARNESTGTVLWTRMENWIRSNVVVQEAEDAIYFVDKGILEKVRGSTGETLWSKSLNNTDYSLSPISGGGVLLSESKSTGSLIIRRFDSNGTETGSQTITHTGDLYPRLFQEKGDGTLIIVGTTTGIISASTGTTITNAKQAGSDSFVMSIASAFSSAPIVEKPIIRGNSLYTIVDGPSWTQAEANAVKLGGQLVSINNAQESYFLKESGFLRSIHANYDWQDGWDVHGGAWIGLTRRGGNDWQWSSQQDYLYNNWNPGEPSGDGGGNEDAYIYTYGNSEGKWNDIPAGWSPLPGIAEIPFIRRGDSAYVIVEGPTWEEAEANAVKLGGHLVTINDAAENDWIKQTFNSEPFGGHNNDAWIGLRRQNISDSFSWADGSGIGYSNWYPGEPNGSSQQGPYATKYGGMWLGAQSIGHSGPMFGFWNDYGNDLSSRGIAEIKLAPNNTPTGTPLLSGNFKAGQVITIDKTPIQDADNFTGYTPDYNYSFEVSNDNGNTWTPLTSADATDNNSTYTLTAAEVGKQVRGVVSYLDGYGSNEVVITDEKVIEKGVAEETQVLSFTDPTNTRIRRGFETQTGIAYDVSTKKTALAGVGVNLFFDSSQVGIATTGTLFQKGLLDSQIVADTTNADNNAATDSIFSISYADFEGEFPGVGIDLPLILADLKIIATENYTGTSLFLTGEPAIGFSIKGSQLDLGFNDAPIVNSNIPDQVLNRGREFYYTLPADLFSDTDSELSLTAISLPDWLTFDPLTKTFSGNAVSGGVYDIEVSAADELGSVATSFSLMVREVQSLFSSATPIKFQRGQDITVPINYSTTDGSQTTGLSFRIHYNSSLLTFDSVRGITNKAPADLFQIGASQQDASDFDNDATTDRYIPVNIASFSGNLPSGIKLGDLTFKATNAAFDPITGFKVTSVNFSEQEAAQGYGFSSTSASLMPLGFNLDVDGDGKVTALGDGLMIVRKLFGSAFAGDALTNKAISPTATRSTAEIHSFIQDGIDNGFLDVDKDGKTTALGDGLMIIRHLFGAAFAGDALISKAISPNSPYFGDIDSSSMIAANIDFMRPLTV